MGHGSMGTIYEEIGCRIAELRKRRDWTQEQLAEAAKLTTSYVARIEAGKRQARLESLANLSGALGVSVADVLRSAEGYTEAPASGVVEELGQIAATLPASDVELLIGIAKRLRQLRESLRRDRSKRRERSRGDQRRTR